MKKIDENIINDFLKISTRRELAKVLGVEYKVLTYNLFKLKLEKKYEVFEIKKRNGKIRKIIAPNSGIKFIQKNI